MFKHEIVPSMIVFSPGYDILGAEVSKMYCMTVANQLEKLEAAKAA